MCQKEKRSKDKLSRRKLPVDRRSILIIFEKSKRKDLSFCDCIIYFSFHFPVISNVRKEWIGSFQLFVQLWRSGHSKSSLPPSPLPPSISLWGVILLSLFSGIRLRKITIPTHKVWKTQEKASSVPQPTEEEGSIMSSRSRRSSARSNRQETSSSETRSKRDASSRSSRRPEKRRSRREKEKEKDEEAAAEREDARRANTHNSSSNRRSRRSSNNRPRRDEQEISDSPRQRRRTENGGGVQTPEGSTTAGGGGLAEDEEEKEIPEEALIDYDQFAQEAEK